MFTGLVQHVAAVRAVEKTPSGARLRVDLRGWSHSPALGESIAMNGCCLTVAGIREGVVAFDVVPETLARTTLGCWRDGTRVNVEHAATPTTLLGGHVVQGHVDGVAQVMLNGGNDGAWLLRLDIPAPLMEFMAPKGSVCVDGVSLTLAAVDPAQRAIDIALIPTTLEQTTLGALKPGDGVNIECDVMAKTVVHWLRNYRS